MLRAALPTPATFERALRELKQLQRAQGPRLARVLDFGREPDGGLFVVTELVSGQPLDRLVAGSGALTVDRAKKIVAQIGESLLEGQKVGVVHHDLSPKNVLVAEGDEVKVINFVAPVPVTETVFGVPEYLSPEQAEGKLVDQRSNTYSLGAIMTLLLSGRPPVEGPGRLFDFGSRPARGRLAAEPLDGRPHARDRSRRWQGDGQEPNRRPLTLRQFLTEVSALVPAEAAAARPRWGRVRQDDDVRGRSPGDSAAGERGARGPGGRGQQWLGRGRVHAGCRGGTGRAAHAASPGVERDATSPDGAPRCAGLVPPASTRSGSGRHHGGAAGGKPAHARAGHPPAEAPESDPGAMTPPPVSQVAPPSVAGGPSMAPTPKPAAGGTFRETLWFKKGDVDQMVAEARARVEAAREKSVAPPPRWWRRPSRRRRPLPRTSVPSRSATSTMVP